jgi:DNA-binding transcriptional ArsR family regulator
VIDTLRKQIQDRLDQLVAEAEKLRKALAALDPRGHQAAARGAPPRQRSTRRQAPARPAAKTRRRAAAGATRSRVLAAVADGEARTAGEIAAATGLARGTVSTTLSRLATSGEVGRADRGYTLTKEGGGATAASPEPTPPSG